MPVSMTIRDIPNEVQDALAERASRAGQSLQEYVRGEFIELARRPTMAELMERIRARKAATSSSVTTEQVLHNLDEDRR
jgi:hypothetical protein